MRALPAGLLCVGVAELLVAHERVNPLNDPYAPLIAVGVIAACFAVIVREQDVLAAGCGVGLLVLVEGVVGDGAHNAGALIAPLFVMAYRIGTCSAPRASAIGLTVMLATFEGGVVLSAGAWVPALFAIAPWASGRIARSQREIAAALQRSTEQLEAEQDAYARLAVEHERARIARELHDVVSHNLAGVVVQAGAGRVASSAAREQTTERFSRIRQASEHGLQELSRLAEIIKADANAGTAGRRPLRLDDLLENARAAGLVIQHVPSSDDLRLPHDITHTAYRIVQEALTNAVKHAPGATVTIRTSLRAAILELDVCDNGDDRPVSNAHLTGSGIGLHGMHWRVAELGGELTVGPDPHGGWRVTARIPVARVAHEPGPRVPE
jgi:signal transduction histidine kinase